MFPFLYHVLDLHFPNSHNNESKYLLILNASAKDRNSRGTSCYRGNILSYLSPINPVNDLLIVRSRLSMGMRYWDYNGSVS